MKIRLASGYNMPGTYVYGSVLDYINRARGSGVRDWSISAQVEVELKEPTEDGWHWVCFEESGATGLIYRDGNTGYKITLCHSGVLNKFHQVPRNIWWREVTE